MGEAVRRARGVVERVDCDVLGYTMTPGGTAKWPSGPESLRPEAVGPGRIVGNGSRWPLFQGGMMKRGGFLKRRGPLRRRRLVAAGTITNKMLDDACRAVVFARDGYRCVMCGKTTRLQWSHVYNRSYRSLVWVPLACKTLCAGCHKFKWHEPPPGFDPKSWFRSRFPGRMEEIDAFYFANKGKKIDRRMTLIWLQQELKRYQKVA
jgi:hypothetical protein